LGAAGADVIEVVAYRTAAPERLDDALIGMVCQGQVDAVIFFSPSAVQQFAGAVGTETFARIGGQIALAAVGPVTASAIRKAGAIPAVEAPRATSGGVVEALERHFIYVGSK
jgi:uroporphyrinogen-III synthase